MEDTIDINEITSRIKLSPDELDWLKAGHKIRARVAISPPFHMWEDGPYGISVDYMRSICDGYQMQCEFVNVVPWHQAIDHLQSAQEFDLLLTIKRTAERERLISFTQDYLNPPWVIFTRNSNTQIKDFNHLAGKSVSIERGFVMHKLLKTKHPEIKLKVVQNTEEALTLLAEGSVDAYIGNLTVGVYLINRLGYNNVKVSAPTPFGNHNQAMAVRPDWPKLTSLINRFLLAMTPAEHAALTNRWLSVRYDHGIEWSFLHKVLSGIALTVIVVIGFFCLLESNPGGANKKNESRQNSILHGLTNYFKVSTSFVKDLSRKPIPTFYFQSFWNIC